jgi:hypothetical protein
MHGGRWRGLRLKIVGSVVNHEAKLDIFILGTIVPKYCTLKVKSSLIMASVLGIFYRSHVLDYTVNFIQLTLCPV